MVLELLVVTIMNITFMQKLRLNLPTGFTVKKYPVICLWIKRQTPCQFPNSKLYIKPYQKSGVVKILRIPRGDRRYFNYPRPSSKTKDPNTKKRPKNKRSSAELKKKQSSLSMIGSRSCKCSFKCIVLRQSAGLVSVAFFEIGIGPLLFCEWPVLIRLGLIYFTWGFPNAYFFKRNTTFLFCLVI